MMKGAKFNSCSEGKLFSGLLIFHILFVVIMTYPISFNMSRALCDLGDCVLNLYILGWDFLHFNEKIFDIFNAGFFYPEPYALAYSEHLIGGALLGWPVWIVTRDFILSYNFILLSSFVLSGVGMGMWVFRLTRNVEAAILSGILFAYSPYKMSQMTHIQNQLCFWMPFTLYFLDRFIEKWKWKDGIFTMLCFVLQCISCLYYALFFSVFIVVFGIYFLLVQRNRLHLNRIVQMIILFLITGMLLFPFFVPYLNLSEKLDYVRDLEVVKMYSAGIESYLATSGSNFFHGKLTGILKKPEGELFPGFTVVFLCLYFVFILVLQFFRKEKKPKTKKKYHTFDWKIFLIFASVLFIILSFGPDITFQNKDIVSGPYIFLYRFFPGFSGLRVPARLAVLVQLCLTALAGLVFANILSGFKKTGIRTIFALTVILFSVLELFCIPLNYESYDLKHYKNHPAFKFLDSGKPAVHLPVMQSEEVWVSASHYMVLSLFHGCPVLNGYSGHNLPGYFESARILNEFPSKESLFYLKQKGIRNIIIHKRLYQRDWKSQLNKIQKTSSPHFEIKYQDSEFLIICL